MTSRPLDPVDAAWFHMDGPVNTSVVTALATARHAFDFDRTRRLLDDRLAAIAPFRCRVVERGLAFDSPCWEEMTDFDIDQHVHHRALPAGAGQADLLELVADLASQPLPPSLPLWQAHVVDGPGTHGAFVFRYHHCIGDGGAMVDVVRRVFDVSGAAPVQARPRARGVLDGAATSLLQVARTGLDAVGALAADLLKPADPVSPFKGRFVARQRLACSAAIPLARLRTISRAFDATINDLVVAGVAGALRHYLLEHGHAAEGASLRAMMPVNLRPPERAQAGGNEFGLAILALPVELDDALARLRASRQRSAELRQSSEAVGMRWLLDAFGRGPKAVQHVLQGLFGSKTSLVLTNVAGPARPLSLAGRRIVRMMFWVPHPGEDLGLGVSVFSYRGKLSLGVIGDAVRLPDPGRIAQLFEHEIAALQRHAASPAGHRPAAAPGALQKSRRARPTRASVRRSPRSRRARSGRRRRRHRARGSNAPPRAG